MTADPQEVNIIILLEALRLAHHALNTAYAMGSRDDIDAALAIYNAAHQAHRNALEQAQEGE